MAKLPSRRLSVQETAVILDSTSAEICRLLSIGRLSGIKRKEPGRPGNAQWQVDPKSLAKELKFVAKRKKLASKKHPK